MTEFDGLCGVSFWYVGGVFEGEIELITRDLELQSEVQLIEEGMWHSLWNDTFPFF